MKAKPHVTISMKGGDAVLFFGVDLHANNFRRNKASYKRVRPSFIIYQDTLYTHPRVRFKTGDAGNNYFKKANPLSLDEYDCLYGMIMDEYIKSHRKREMKPNIPLNTGSGTAFFFFETGVAAKLFDAKGLNSYGASIPSFIIHQEILFCRPGFYFVAGDAGDHYFSSTDVLSSKEFLLLCEFIYSSHQELEKSMETAKKLYNSDHMVDAFAYAAHHMQSNLPVNAIEKKLIDQLDISGLERSLREALKRENYEAAAHIRNRVQEKGYIIFEMDGKLLIRRPALKTTNQNK
jgi:hypothetical protein